MKKRLFGVIPLLILALGLSGCNTIGQKAASQSIIYGVAAVLSLLLLIGCCCLDRKKKSWFVLLFSSVLVVNIGYTLLSISSCLEMALLANRISYLGSVFLPLAMLMIILNVTNSRYPKWLHGALGVLSIIVFLIGASPGILPIYYKEVSFAVVNAVSSLLKFSKQLRTPHNALKRKIPVRTYKSVLTGILLQKKITNPNPSPTGKKFGFVSIGPSVEIRTRGLLNPIDDTLKV